MKRWLMFVLVGLSAILFFSGCEKKEEFVKPKTAGESAKQARVPDSQSTQEQAKQMRDEFVAKMQQEMDELNMKLAELRAKAQSLSGQAREEIEAQIKRLEQEQKEAAVKFDALKAATVETWNELKSGAAEALERFKRSIEKAPEEPQKTQRI